MKFIERVALVETLLAVVNNVAVIWANFEEARWNRIRRQLDALALSEKRKG